MKVTRKFTKEGQDPFATTTWVKRSSRISNPDGSVVFEMNDAEVPESWSQLATDIMVSKYFRKAGVPQVDENWMIQTDDHGEPILGPERSARQVIHRLAGCWRQWGEAHGYFDSTVDAQAFYDELCYMLVHQMCAPNSPQWFNTGLNFAYGINGPAQGHWYVDPKTGRERLSEDAYTHPQPHACFIQSVDDDLVNEGGIMDLWVREARLFKYGSGTGTNFSQLRAADELLSGGGRSSGLMSWLKIGDRAAGAIKSGGTTRRAAKMVCLDMDHPDISDFVSWKVREELKVAALVEGMKALSDEQKETAQKLGLSLTYDYNGEAYATVSGQNANNSVRIPDAFFDAVDADGDWELVARTTGEVTSTLRARELWDQIGYAAWRCADPGVQYDSTINAWHTCPASGRINASNPCSEYMFLDNTACNLASLNLLKFYRAEDRSFDWDSFEHGVDLWTMVLEISVLMAQFPSREIARLSYDYRTLGLGYANIGAVLMRAGVPYDSEEARAFCGCVTSILTGRSYRMSALMAREHGPFPGFEENREHMLRVIRNHRRAAHGVDRSSSDWEELRISPVPIDHELILEDRVPIRNANKLRKRACKAWDDALEFGMKHGFRNAQTTVIAPTGTIGLLMDCDTTGVEPDFALVKFKKLAGGGYFKIVNQSVEPALAALGYAKSEIHEMIEYVLGSLRLDVPMPGKDGSEGTATGTFHDFLHAQGFTDESLQAVEGSLASVFELKHAFSAWGVGDDVLRAVGVDPEVAKSDMSFNLLRELGLTREQERVLNRVICGTQTIEGAPHLREEHLPVFDCANTCGEIGTRYIAAEGHIRMMAAAQPFITGAISKTINLPNDATVEDITDAYRLSWELGLKANALYRDGCKLSQPLSTKSEDADADDSDVLDMVEDDEAVAAALDEVTEEVVAVAETTEPMVRETIVERIVERPMRRRLADTRRSLTHKFNISGHEGYLTVGLYDDGQPGELFITMAKEGSTIGGLMDSLGTATSVALQYGVPVESLVKKFTHQRFEPAGMTTNRDIPFAKSLVDYIFRWMGMQFVAGYREANSPSANQAAPAPSAPSNSMTRTRGGLSVAKPVESPKADEVSGGRLGKSSDASVEGSADAPGGRVGGLNAPVGSGDGPSTRTLTDRAAQPIAPAMIEVKRTSDSSQAAVVTDVKAAALSASLSEFQEDAPACDVCGTVTVRSGTCYKCLNCGNSMGCS